jgi:polyhydroxybutyrate depolymerase
MIRKLRIALILALAALSETASAREPSLLKLRVDGSEREALVFAPSTSVAAKSAVVFGFHGHGGNMRFAARGMHFQDAWSEAIVVYMQGLPTPSLFPERERGLRTGWQHHPGELNDRDLKFFDAVLATLHEKYSVDDNRIYASGFSNGGYFTYLLWAERPNVFAAFAPGAGLILPSFHLSQPRPVLHFGGRRDRLVPFANQERTIDEVRQLNGCAGQSESCGMNCTLYPSARGTPVMTFIHEGGHFYPPPVTGLIVKFFQENPRKG